MAYTVVPTVSTGDAWTAANHNTYIKDNFSAGVPDIFTTAGDIAYATAADAATRLGIGALGDVLVSTGTAPRWSSTGVTAASGYAANVLLTNTLTASANSDALYQQLIQGVFAKSTYTDLSAIGVAVGGAGWTASGAGTIAGAYGVYITPPTIGTANWALYVTGGSSVIAGGIDYNTTGIAYIGDDANANMTTGLTINQGAASNEILTFKAWDGTTVAHGMTSLTEGDSFATFAKAQSDGGLVIAAYSAGANGLFLKGYVTDEDDGAKSTSSSGALRIDGLLKSGTTAGSMSANANILAVRSGTTTRFVLDSDGDSHQDVGTSWTNFSTHDDAGLLTALSVLVSKPKDPIRDMFRGILQEHRVELEELKLVSFNEDGHHFVNMSKLLMLTVGAAMQNARKVTALEGELSEVRRLLSAA